MLCACLLGTLLAVNGLYCRKKVFAELRREAKAYAEESQDAVVPGEEEEGDLRVEGLLDAVAGGSEFYEPPVEEGTGMSGDGN